MHAVRRRLRACAWLALLSIAALAAGPTVSRLLLPAGNAAPEGQRSQHRHQHRHDMTIGAALPAPQHPPAHEHALEHCGLCLLAAHAFTFLPEPPKPTVFVESTCSDLGRTAPAVPRLRCDWSPASSRGPPLRA